MFLVEGRRVFARRKHAEEFSQVGHYDCGMRTKILSTFSLISRPQDFSRPVRRPLCKKKKKKKKKSDYDFRVTERPSCLMDCRVTGAWTASIHDGHNVRECQW
jgi:hypothetical protein